MRKFTITNKTLFLRIHVEKSKLRIKSYYINLPLTHYYMKYNLDGSLLYSIIKLDKV
jgi:hypothetical protein